MPQDCVGYIRQDKCWRSKDNPMKLLFVLAMSPLALVMADAAEQDTVNRCATIIRGFQQMPEKAIQETTMQQSLQRNVVPVAPVKPASLRRPGAEYYKKDTVTSVDAQGPA